MMQSFEDFLEKKSEFQLGKLTTESFHPLTVDLKNICQHDLSQGIETLRSCDILALNKYESLKSKLNILKEEVKNHQGNIFLVGCGATGRLVLHLEKVARMQGRRNIFSLMAGGDAALIKSIESVEDSEEFGAKHLREFSIKEGDIVIGVTEGGETSYVIGAIKEGFKITKKNPFILYCNSDEELISTCERSRWIIENKQIQNISLNVGPMALAGSTRMQASTVLHMALGESLFSLDSEKLKYRLKNIEFSFIEKLILEEAKAFKDKRSVVYRCPSRYALTVLTDTTERSPTFGLNPFENSLYLNEVNSFNHLELKNETDNQSAWKSLLSRTPRGLEWKELQNSSSLKTLYGFLIHDGHKRNKSIDSLYFDLESRDGELVFSIEREEFIINIEGLNFLEESLLLKMLLNIYSTALMGFLGRFESNIMTWVRASNYKLIDRTIRYANLLLMQKNIEVPYDDLARKLFKLKASESESVVELLVSEFF